MGPRQSTALDRSSPARVWSGTEGTEEAERIFRALSEGGTVKMPIAETFWAAGFGMCVDRFGTPWIVNGGEKT